MPAVWLRRGALLQKISFLFAYGSGSPVPTILLLLRLLSQVSRRGWYGSEAIS
jgi:hypothetical protein